jgi:hypothetical protein
MIKLVAGVVLMILMTFVNVFPQKSYSATDETEPTSGEVEVKAVVPGSISVQITVAQPDQLFGQDVLLLNANPLGSSLREQQNADQNNMGIAVVMGGGAQNASLYMSSDNTELVSEYRNRRSVIPSTSNGSINANGLNHNSWGYSLDGSNFQPIPSGFGQLVATQSGSDSEVSNIYFGVNANNGLAPGIYRGNVMYTAVASI